MSDIRRILVVLAEGEQSLPALEHARMLAEHHEASLTIIDVKPYLETYTAALSDLMPEDELRALILKHRSDQLQRIVKRHEFRASQITGVKVLDGVPFIEIIREVLRNEHDLIVKVAEGETGPNERIFGSTDMHLMRKSPVPVWILRPESPQRVTRIIAAIDAVADDEAAEAFNRRILDLAYAVMRMTSAELHVITAWHLIGEDSMRYSPFLKIEEQRVDELLQQTEDRVLRYQSELERWCKRSYSDASLPEFHRIKGIARNVIPEFIRDSGAELVVMGTVGRSGIPGLLIGNTAETILGEVSCSALTLKPHGFITPVETG